MKICIAGKNDISVDFTDWLLSSTDFTKDDIGVCFNKTDSGEDDFQKSFRKYSHLQGLREVGIKDIYDIEDLIFISLEYDSLIDVVEFSSERLFNIHFSLLPKYRGMYTSAWPILNGESESGVTLHLIDSGIDTGDIIAQESFKISVEDSARDVYLKYITYGTQLIIRHFPSLVDKSFSAKKQNESLASYYTKDSIDYSRISIDFARSAKEVRNQIRALCFKEYQLPLVNGQRIINCKILSVSTEAHPGDIITMNEDYIDLSTLDFDVRLFKDPD